MEQTFYELLKKHRLSNTQGRKTVFRLLLAENRALSMSELIKKAPSMDRVTVYRIIGQFENAGIVIRVQLCWKYKIELSDAFRTHHHHMTCITCGKTYDFEEPENLDAILNTIAVNVHFTIQHHSLELRGQCQNCTTQA